MLDLVITTGASRGIGKSIAYKCSNTCKNLINIASSDKLTEFEPADKNCNLISIQINLQNDFRAIEFIVSDYVNQINPKSIGIVLAAAQLGSYGGLLSADLNEWNKQFQCNVLGNLAVVKGCSKIISAGAKTRIAMFAGGGAAYGYPEFFGYSLSKVAVVRAAENLGMELSKINPDASVIAVAPGAVATDMLAQVIASGGSIKTYTDISEPTNFVFKFLNDEFNSKELNGRFVHVRDDLDNVVLDENHFKLRRIQ